MEIISSRIRLGVFRTVRSCFTSDGVPTLLRLLNTLFSTHSIEAMIDIRLELFTHRTSVTHQSLMRGVGVQIAWVRLAI